MYIFYFEARKCSRQTGSVYALRINLLNIMIRRTLLRGRGTSMINEVKIQNKTKITYNSHQFFFATPEFGKITSSF